MTTMAAGSRKKKRLMPSMHGAAIQCCMCIVGVFMFLGGLIMMSTGICLILNYGVFDVTLLPPDLQNDEGKKTVGIILTSCGLLAVLISVIVSALYLCNKSKSASINPDDLSRIPSSARNNTPDKHERRRNSFGHKTHPLPNGNGVNRGNVTSRTNGTVKAPVKNIPGSTEVKHPRPFKKGTKHHRKYPRRRLEEIKEQDAISRKTMEGALHNDYDETPRSGSFSSEMTLDDQRIPKVVLDQHENNRPPSVDSASTSQASDISNYRYLENNKSRRELQFVPDSTRNMDAGQYDTFSKDSISLDKDDNSSGGYSKVGGEDVSINSENTPFKNKASNLGINEYSDKSSAGGINRFDPSINNLSDNQTSFPEVYRSNESIISYKTLHHPEVHGGNTAGRVSPQVGVLDTGIEIQSENSAFQMEDESV